MSPPRASEATLAFLGPGFLHLFGNLVFTIQGNALALPAGETALPAGETALPAGAPALPAGATALPAGATALPERAEPMPADSGRSSGSSEPIGSGGRERQAILTASERAGSVLRLWRWLLGDPMPATEPAAELLAALGEILRVPLREAQQGLQLQGLEQASGRRVEAATFALAICSAVHTLLRELPNGIQGTVVLALLEPTPGELRVRLQFLPPADTLPFPIPTAALLAAMPPASPGRPAPRLQPAARGVELQFGAGACGQTSPGRWVEASGP